MESANIAGDNSNLKEISDPHGPTGANLETDHDSNGNPPNLALLKSENLDSIAEFSYPPRLGKPINFNQISKTESYTGPEESGLNDVDLNFRANLEGDNHTDRDAKKG